MTEPPKLEVKFLGLAVNATGVVGIVAAVVIVGGFIYVTRF